MPDDVSAATAASPEATAAPAATPAEKPASEIGTAPEDGVELPAFVTGNRDFASDTDLHESGEEAATDTEIPPMEAGEEDDGQAWYPGWDLTSFEDAHQHPYQNDPPPQQTEQYPHQQGTYPPQPPQQQGFQVPEHKIEQFVKDPDAYIEQVARDRLDQMIGPYAYHINEVSQQANKYLNAARRAAVTDAYQNVEKGYEEIFTRDEVFRSDENFRNVVDGAMQSAMSKAVQAAMAGQPEALYQFRDPRYYSAFINGIKGYLGIRMPAQGSQKAVKQPEAVVAGQKTQAQSAETFELPPDLEEVARVMGPAYRKRLIEGEKERRKRGDLEFHRQR